MKASITTLSASLLLALGALPAHADAPSALQLSWDARWRYEQVGDDAFARDARADTLRLRLGLQADLGQGWSAMAEGAGVASAGNAYNSGANGRTAYPAIGDPHGHEWNQWWLRWRGDAFSATAGRQRVQLDNQRWVGSVSWRQFEQTFDGVALSWQPARDWTLRYDWLDRVHRVAGPDALNRLARARKLDTHLVNLAFATGRQQFVGYAYLHKDRDVAAASTATYGLRWVGTPGPRGGLGWTAEGALQRDYANNAASFSHDYWLLEPAWTQAGITAKLGWEYLGGNGRHALQTPLATLHAFNGWDDQFIVTPAGGLQDRYVSAQGAFASRRFAWVVGWHDYRAVRGGRYGSEWDASLAFPLAEGLQGLVKLADYRADGFGRDSAKLWLQLEWRGATGL